MADYNTTADHRPWGYFEVLSDAQTFKVKRVVVYPGKRLSLQRHRKRAEHWLVVEGEGRVTLDDKSISITYGSYVDIPVGAAHRIENTGTDNMSFIEIQTGEYFGEDDIERIEDDFGRV